MKIYVHSQHAVLQEGLSVLVRSFGYTVAAEVNAEVAIRDLCGCINYPPPFTIPTLALIVGGETNAEKTLLLGYRGYIQASQEASHLKMALRAVRKGENWAERKVMSRLLDNPAKSTLLLTEREQEVFNLLLLGLSNRQIAERLSIAEKTVKGYLSSLYSKLGVSGRKGLISYDQQKMEANLNRSNAA